MPVGYLGQGSVEGFLEEMEMAYYGESRKRAWWEVLDLVAEVNGKHVES